MSDRMFGYYEDWKTELLTCPACGWTGTFQQGFVEYYRELMDSSCPKCRPSLILAIVSHPTMQETEANWDKLSERQQQQHLKRRKFLDRLESQRLRSPKQLCDLKGESLILSWGFCTNEDDDCRNVIRCGDTFVWDEPAVYEAYERFGEVARILKENYGRRLLDLEPTEASWTYLLGDELLASAYVEEARRRIRGKQL